MNRPQTFYFPSASPSCNNFNTMSILMFIAAIWRVRSSMLLPPVAGAIAQEVIDVAAVLNALRTTLPGKDLSDSPIS